FGQRYDADGVPQGAEFRVHAASVGEQGRPSVAMDTAGNFVVVWHALHIAGRRFDALGTPQGAELEVSTDLGSFQNLASVAAGATGEFVAVWISHYQAGDSRGIFGQR